MSAVYNNIKTMSTEDLDRQRHNDRIDPIYQHAFDIEYRLRCLEAGTVATPIKKTEPQDTASTKENAEAITIANDTDDVPTVSADPEGVAESTSGTQEDVPAEVSTILHHMGHGNIVEEDDKLFAIGIVSKETDDIEGSSRRITPKFETEEELFVFMVNHVGEWLGKSIDTFEFFWDEEGEEDEPEMVSE